MREYWPKAARLHHSFSLYMKSKANQYTCIRIITTSPMRHSLEHHMCLDMDVPNVTNSTTNSYIEIQTYSLLINTTLISLSNSSRSL